MNTFGISCFSVWRRPLFADLDLNSIFSEGMLKEEMYRTAQLGLLKIWLGHLKLKLRRRHSGNRHASKHDGLGYYYYYYCLVWHTKKRSQNSSFGGKKYKDYSQLPNDHIDQRHQCPCLSVIEYKEKLSVVSLIS